MKSNKPGPKPRPPHTLLTNIAVRIPQPVEKRLRAEAATKNMTLSGYCRRVLLEHATRGDG